MIMTLLKKNYSFICIVVIAIIFASCDGNCKDETIEKIEWITRYEDVYKDTLVRYSILVDKREYSEVYKEVKHTITIRNDNEVYSNRFAVLIKYGYQDSEYFTTETKSNDTAFVIIEPLSSNTFSFYTQGGYSYNFNSEYEILQMDTNFTYQNKIDELKVSQETVNSCTANIEALKEKYNTIKELYKVKTNQTTSK